MSSQWTLWLSILTGLVLVMLIAPSVFAFNRGRALRNMALWLGAFVLLGWVYKAFGPFGTPAETRLQYTPTLEQQQQTEQPADDSTTMPGDELHDGEPQSFEPPKEL